MPDIEAVEKKIREVRFFLGKLWERSRIAAGDSEELDFYLSALLAAGRSVDYRLRHEFYPSYPTFFKAWQSGLSADDQTLLKFMTDDRNVEIHESGSIRTVGHQAIAINGMYRDAGGTYYASAPMGEQATILKPIRQYTVGGKTEDVTGTCHRYFELLKKLVADFRVHAGL